MKTVRAVVTKKDGNTIEVRSEHGRRMKMPNKYNLKVGDPIMVMFQASTSKAFAICPAAVLDNEVSEISDMIDEEKESESDFLRPLCDGVPCQDAGSVASVEPWYEPEIDSESESESEFLRPWCDEGPYQDSGSVADYDHHEGNPCPSSEEHSTYDSLFDSLI
jgi:hypothetical protein